MSDPITRPGPVPVPARPEADGPSRTAAYRPLSLLAIVGAGLAGLYAAVVILGGLVALVRGDPWLLPGWTLLLPFAAAGLSLVALLRVQRSEGTLAGEKVARWGLLLSVLVGLSYWAYVGATYFAISREADRFARGWVDKLDNDQVMSAFRLTLPPAERPEDAHLRDLLEPRFNAVTDKGRRGPLGIFLQSELVRMLEQGGPGTTVESLGVEDWDYAKSGYKVQLLYKVSNPQASFHVGVVVQGKEGKRSEGRQWHVLWEKCAIKSTPALEPTAEGKRAYQLATQARDYAGNYWIHAMIEGKTDEVFLATLPAAEREHVRARARDARLALLLAEGVGPGAAPCAAPGAALARAALVADKDFGRATFLPGFDRFLAGGLVRAEKDVFWAPDDVKEEVVNLVRQEFRQPSERLAAGLMPESGTKVPRMRREGDRFLAGYDFAMRVPSAAPRYAVEGRIVVDCDAAEAERGAVTSWRVRSLDLVSGKTIMEQAPGGAGEMPGP